VLERSIQDRLAAFVRAGGRLLLHGRLPVVDDDGSPCTVLADALGLRSAGVVEGTPDYFPSVRATSWAGEEPEVRVGMLEHLTGDGETLAVDIADGSPVAVDVRVDGGGHAVVLACDYPCHLGFWQRVLERIDIHRRIIAEGNTPGLVTTSTADATGQRLVHLINVAPVPQAFTLTVDGVSLKLHLSAREGLILPVGVRLDDSVLRWSTAELDGPGDGSTVLLRRAAGKGSALIETTRNISVDGDAAVSRTDEGHLVTWPAGRAGDRLTVRLS
jgi:beta-galactosidase